MKLHSMIHVSRGTAKIPVAMLLCLTTAFAGQSRTMIRVRLKPDIEIGSTFVSLGDLAAIDGGDERLRRVVSRILVGPAPASGKERKVSRAEISARLETAGLARKSVCVEGATAVVVSFVAAAAVVPATASSRARGLERDGTPPRDGHVATVPSSGRSRRAAARHVAAAASPAVQKDTRLLLRRKGGIIEIEEPGTALESGALGDVVLVRNSRTGRQETARVTGRNRAAIVTSASVGARGERRASWRWVGREGRRSGNVHTSK